MDVGIVGLGRMGSGMARRLLRGGHRVVVFNRSPGPVEALVGEGAVGTRSLNELVAALPPPRAVWVVLPAGEVTGQAIDQLAGHLDSGDTVVDAGNSYYKDSIRRMKVLADRGLHFVDQGTSGGVWGLEVGFCLMVGGEAGVVTRLDPVFHDLAPQSADGPGYAHVGPAGAGHYVKMVHNGIEYGMMQAYAEGFELLSVHPEFQFDLERIARLWNQGSVIRSWLLELAAAAFAKDANLSTIAPYVEDSGEGRWTVATAMELDVPAPVITLSLLERFRSRQPVSFAAKVLAALRKEFGGHAVRRVE